LHIINKDEDGYNNRLSNLDLVPKSVKQIREGAFQIVAVVFCEPGFSIL